MTSTEPLTALVDALLTGAPLPHLPELPSSDSPELLLLRQLCRDHRLRATLAAEHLLGRCDAPTPPTRGTPSPPPVHNEPRSQNLPILPSHISHTARLRAAAAKADLLKLGALEDTLTAFSPWLGPGLHAAPSPLVRLAHDRLDTLTALLSAEPSLRRIADLLGRARRGPRHLEAGLGRDAIIGVTLGGEVTDALPAELALLATPDTEDLFLARLLERRLLALELDGPLPHAAARGPVAVLLDTSGSLASNLERAKAATLAVLEQLLRNGRRAELTLFGGHGAHRTVTFARGRTDLNALLAFLTQAYLGGTDLDGPLRAALDREPAHDLLIVTDGLVALSPPTLDRLQSRVSAGLTLVTVHVQGPSNPTADFEALLAASTATATLFDDDLKSDWLRPRQ